MVQPDVSDRSLIERDNMPVLPAINSESIELTAVAPPDCQLRPVQRKRPSSVVGEPSGIGISPARILSIPPTACILMWRR